MTLWLLVWLLGCHPDADADGYVSRDDCDDHDAQVHPGAPERCNHRDDDCDGETDEASDAPVVYADRDADGYGDPSAPSQGCPPPRAHVQDSSDCDDQEPEVHPGAVETCDGVDQDCDGRVDEDPTPPLYEDNDADGHGDPTRPADCVAWAVTSSDDCDDDDDRRAPGLPERCDGIDNDCDGATLPGEVDLDGDQVLVCAGDCDDHDPTRGAGLLEICDGVDNDCDGAEDGPLTWWDRRWHARVMVDVTPPAIPSTLPLAIDVDFRAALDQLGVTDAFDPDTLRVVLQGCGGAGEIVLPSTFLDRQRGLFQAGLSDDPEGDEAGAVAFLYDLDGDLTTLEASPTSPFQVGVYFRGLIAGPTWTTDLQASATSLSTGPMEARFDPRRGGLMSALSIQGTGVASQAEATQGNGLRTTAGGLAAQSAPAAPQLLDSSPVTAAVRSARLMGNGGGEAEGMWTYRAFAGRSELWMEAHLEITQDTTVEGLVDHVDTVRPWQATTGELVSPLTHAGASYRWARTQDSDHGLTWVWVGAPQFLIGVGEANGQVWAAANDYSPCCTGPQADLLTGERAVDHALMVLVPHGASPPQVDVYLQGVTTAAQPPEGQGL